MTRSFALWVGTAAVVAIGVAAVTVAVFPRQSRRAEPAALLPPPPPPASHRPVALSVDLGPAPRSARGPVTRGGEAKPTVSHDSGQLGSSTRLAPPRVTAHSLPAPKPVSRPVAKRPVSIGAVSGPNGDSGLAGASPAAPAVSGGFAGR